LTQCAAQCAEQGGLGIKGRDAIVARIGSLAGEQRGDPEIGLFLQLDGWHANQR